MMVGGTTVPFSVKTKKHKPKKQVKNPCIYRLKLSEKRAYGRRYYKPLSKRLMANLNHAPLLIAAKCL